MPRGFMKPLIGKDVCKAPILRALQSSYIGSLCTPLYRVGLEILFGLCKAPTERVLFEVVVASQSLYSEGALQSSLGASQTGIERGLHTYTHFSFLHRYGGASLGPLQRRLCKCLHTEKAHMLA